MARKETTKNQNNNKIDLSNWSILVDFIKNSSSDDFKKGVADHIQSIIENHTLANEYHFILLYDEFSPINESMSRAIYKGLPKDINNKILFILHSNGGRVEPAYFISKMCSENSSQFIVAIPDKAKSAATLISLGASEIHMGPLSQLGPIDPQIKGIPALALDNALKYIARLCKKYPESKELFGIYLTNKLDLKELGYLQRVSESTVHYAQRLLEGKIFPKGIDGNIVAKKLVYEYKDHGFVIDHKEAEKLLGTTIKYKTIELELCSKITDFLGDVDFLLNILDKKYISVRGCLQDLDIFTFKIEP